MMHEYLRASVILPVDHRDAVLVGRAFVPAYAGPAPVLVRADGILDLSPLAATASELFARRDATATIRAYGTLTKLADLDATLANSDPHARDPSRP